MEPAAPTTQFEKLRQQIQGASQRAIRRLHPEFEKAYREAVGAGSSRDDFARAADAVAQIQTPRFAFWRRLMLAIHDVEWGILRLETAVRLVAAEPTPQMLEALNVSRGRWSECHFYAWLLSAHALLERADTLAAAAWRNLVRTWPAENPPTEKELRSRIRASLGALNELRNAAAHGGGTIEVFSARRRFDEWAVLGVWPDIDDVLNRWGAVHERQAAMARTMTLSYFRDIDETAGLILRSVDWRSLS